jgi:hypothetical protein
MLAVLAEALQVIPNVWTLLGLIAVLGHQMAVQWVNRTADLRAVRGLKALRAEMTECRARWDRVEEELTRLKSAVQFMVNAMPGGSAQKPPGFNPADVERFRQAGGGAG